jgi:hypothetical protein
VAVRVQLPVFILARGSGNATKNGIKDKRSHI